MTELFQSMTLPFLACLLLAGIHVYLGIHVLARQVIFVDLALAQIAALGAIYGILLGYNPGVDALAIKGFSLLFAVVGAGIFSLTRVKQPLVPHEAIIGVVYALALSLAILLSSHLAHGADELRELLSGSILWVDAKTIVYTALLYTSIGFIHFVFRKQFLAISFNKQAVERIRLWDFWFYVTFACVVTSSVAIAGVLLVFCYLIIPALIAMLLAQTLKYRLIIGWIIGAFVSFGGVVISYYQDLPSGPVIVVCFAFALLCVALRRRLWILLGICILIYAVWSLTLHRHQTEHVKEKSVSAQITSADDHERELALREIHAHPHSRHIGILLKAIAIETDDYLRLEMAQILLELHDKRGLPVLLDVMNNGETEQVRQEAAEYLRRIGHAK